MNKFKLDKTDKIMITGGHMTPAFAVIDELQSRGYRNICWVGHKYSQTGDQNLSAEYRIVSSKSIPFIELQSGKVFRSFKGSFRPALKSLLSIPKGFFQARKIVKEESPKVILSFGGYLALPIVVAGKFQKITIYTHEQVIKPGLSNRIISFFANKIFISWKSSKRFFAEKKLVFTGNPIRQAFVLKREEIQENGGVVNYNWHKFSEKPIADLLLNHYNFRFDATKNSNETKIILILGGNQGSHIINENIFKLLPVILNDFTIIHQTGSSSLTQDYEKAIALKVNLPDQLSQFYLPREFINEYDLAEVLSLADLVISRSGANSSFEYMFMNKYCILIPIPGTSGNEQERQAEFLEELGLAKVIYQKDLRPEILNKSIYDVLEYKKLGRNLNNVGFEDTISKTSLYAKEDAAEKIVDEILSFK